MAAAAAAARGKGKRASIMNNKATDDLLSGDSQLGNGIDLSGNKELGTVWQ